MRSRRRRLAHAAVDQHSPSLSRGPPAPSRRPARTRPATPPPPKRHHRVDRQLHRRPSDTGAAPTLPAAAGASAPVPDATGARPDPAGARFTGSSSGKVSNFKNFGIILCINIYCLLVAMFSFVMSDGLI